MHWIDPTVQRNLIFWLAHGNFVVHLGSSYWFTDTKAANKIFQWPMAFHV
jgi:hypothetical protein